jgi:ABC-type amino acid transport substrate-binding protein
LPQTGEGFPLKSVPHSRFDLAAIRRSGSLRLATISFERVPHEYRVNGFDLEIVSMFATTQGLELRTTYYDSYAELIPVLLAGAADVAGGALTVTDERRQLVDFSSETFPSRMVVVTRRPRPPVQRAEDVAGHRFGTERGTSPAEATRSIARAAAIDDSLRIEQLGAALKEGRITAAVYELHVLRPAQRQDPDLQEGMKVGAIGSLALAVPKGTPELLRSLNQFIHELRCDGRWVKLLMKYFGPDAAEIMRMSR